jgi:hypothetical protein
MEKEINIEKKFLVIISEDTSFMNGSSGTNIPRATMCCVSTVTVPKGSMAVVLMMLKGKKQIG